MLSSQFDAYRGSHQPSTGEDAVRFYELDKAMPDFYEKPHHYLWDIDNHFGKIEARRAAMLARGNPDADVRIYRAVPHGVTTINPGDWVTTSKNYALEHGRHHEDPALDKPVIEAVVKLSLIHI